MQMQTPLESIPVFKSFRFRLILFFALLITGLQVFTFMAVYRTTLSNTLAQIEHQLVRTAHTFRLQLADRAGDLAREAGILASDYGFRTAIATSDRPTILSALESLINRIDGDRAMVISLENEIISDTLVRTTRDRMFPFETLIETADEEGQAVSIVTLDGQIYEFTVVPVLAPIPIAWIGIGQTMDDVLAADLKSQSPFDLDISFGLIADSGRMVLKGSTFSGALRARTKEMDIAGIPLDTPRRIENNGTTYVTLVKSLTTGTGGHRAVALLQYSLDLAMAPYRTMMLWVLGTSVASLILALGLAIWIAGSVTRPVRELSVAAGRARSGDYDNPVAVARMDELGRLADGFNHMMTGIKEREKKIVFQARHDSVTGLPNRLSFENRLDAMIGRVQNDPFCVVLFGVDRLAEINNTLGHEVGDLAIRHISDRLLGSVDESDLVARLASDEFILLLPSVGQDDVVPALENILGRFKAPVTLDDVTMDISAHLGVACYPAHGDTAKRLMQRADAAMYQARRAGNAARYLIYDPDQDPHTKARLSLMSEMRTGIQNHEFVLYYQPKVSLEKGSITHVEALIRWIHPENGFMPPDEFIPLAEQTGNIHHITDFSLNTAVAACADWRQKGYQIKVAVNISAKDLLSPNLTDKVTELLARHSLPPDWLILEITEGAMMQDPDMALSMLEQLHNMGVKLSIDDFGTGYSSMAYLKKLPIQEIKIDKSFVLDLAKDAEDAVIVRSTVELGHNLGLTVIAEGVEDEESMDMLKGYGCDLGQGYFFSRPQPKDDLETWLSESPWGQEKGSNQA
jgi:diguanylate cyclase (GGDEF)-like protein